VTGVGQNVADMADMDGGEDRVPKQYRNRLHRLKNAYGAHISESPNWSAL